MRNKEGKKLTHSNTNRIKQFSRVFHPKINSLLIGFCANIISFRDTDRNERAQIVNCIFTRLKESQPPDLPGYWISYYVTSYLWVGSMELVICHPHSSIFLRWLPDFWKTCTNLRREKRVPVTKAWCFDSLRLEERHPVCRVAANILNKQPRTADKGWSSNLWCWGRCQQRLITFKLAML